MSGNAQSSLCFDLDQNTFNHVAVPSADVDLTNATAGSFVLSDYAGLGGDTAAISTYLQGRNTGLSSVAFTGASLYSTGGDCELPP